jgi:hypothetical protein
MKLFGIGLMVFLTATVLILWLANFGIQPIGTGFGLLIALIVVIWLDVTRGGVSEEHSDSILAWRGAGDLGEGVLDGAAVLEQGDFDRLEVVDVTFGVGAGA